jgi:hypothetical protein
MRVAIAVVCATCACGRFDFGARAGDGGGDAADGAIDTSSGDAAIACAPFDEAVMTPTNGIVTSALAWVGDRYAMVMQDTTDLGVIEVGSDGTLGAFHGITTLVSGAYTLNGEGTLAWSGSELAMAWSTEPGAVDLGRFDSTMTPIGTPTSLATNGSAAIVAWSTDRFAVAWCTGGASYNIGEVGSDGSLGQSLSFAAPCAQTLVATPTTYLAGAYEGGLPTTLVIGAPLFNGDELGGDPTLLSNTATPQLRFATMAGVTYAIEPAASVANNGGIQQIADDGTGGTSMIALPLFAGSDIDYVAMAPIGSVLRVLGTTSSSHDVTTDFDPSTGTFSPPIDLGPMPGGISSYPTITAGPGRIAIAYTYIVGGQGMARIIQECL